MAKRDHSLIYKVLRYSLVIPMLICILLTCWQPLRATWGALTLNTKSFEISEEITSQESLRYRRNIQKHFLNLDTYIPMEDIVIPLASAEVDSRLKKLMRNACGKGTIYVWIPLKFRWPLTGERVVDWCWKR